MNQLPLPAAALCCLLLAQCKSSDPDPVAQLPPATQTGANTFGCLLNGQVWTPKGSYGPSNFRLTYDPDYAGGSLLIRAYQADGKSSTKYINMSGSRIARVGTYTVSEAPASTCGASYSYDSNSACGDYGYYNNKPGFVMRGQLVITRLDMGAGIVSGTFAFKLGQTGCDTVRVTQGRFDYKL